MCIHDPSSTQRASICFRMGGHWQAKHRKIMNDHIHTQRQRYEQSAGGIFFYYLGCLNMGRYILFLALSPTPPSFRGWMGLAWPLFLSFRDETTDTLIVHFIISFWLHPWPGMGHLWCRIPSGEYISCFWIFGFYRGGRGTSIFPPMGVGRGEGSGEMVAEILRTVGSNMPRYDESVSSGRDKIHAHGIAVAAAPGFFSRETTRDGRDSRGAVVLHCME
jgi:hypothetical protein